MFFTSQDFRRTLGRFATGIAVVTTHLEGVDYGITVNSLTSVSLDPPLVLICIGNNTDSYELLQRSKIYCVNLLTENQEYLSVRFAKRSSEAVEPFSDLEWRRSETGCPILGGTLGYIDCKIVNTYEGGDHLIFIGEVQDLAFYEPTDEEGKPLSPLLYYQSGYRRLKL
jgi:flavin reductase (DIM6/NTAB) family NADH-FMN oxidoreductase RutF